MDRLAARPRRCPGGLRSLPVVSVGAPAPEGKPPFTEQFPYPGSPSAADLRGPGGANAAFPEMRGARGPRQPRGLRDPGPARPRPPLLKAPHPQLSGLEPPSHARMPACPPFPAGCAAPLPGPRLRPYRPAPPRPPRLPSASSPPRCPPPHGARRRLVGRMNRPRRRSPPARQGPARPLSPLP